MLKPIHLALALLLTFSNVSAQNPGDSLFGSSAVHNIYFNFPQTGYWDSLTAYYAQDKYLRCDMTIDGITISSIGVKFKGNSSYNNPSDKKSFKVDLNEFVSGQKYDDLKKFNLNNGFKDPTFMREKVMLDFCVSKGIPAPRCTYANVYINNQLWGLYTLVEEVNKTFLKTWFGDNDGNLFKGDPFGDLKWMGPTDTTYYNKYELHTNETQNIWSDLVHLLDEINNTPPQSFRDSMDAVLHSHEYIQAWAATNLFANLDSYMGSGHNYFLYHDSLTNRFRWIVWDVNEAFGNFSMNMSVQQLEELSVFHVPTPQTNRPLNLKMIQDQYYKQYLSYVVCEYIHSGFTTTELYAKIDSLADVIRPHVYADPKKFFTNQQFESNITSDMGNIPGLKSFITNRRAAVINELFNYGCFVGMEEQANNTDINVWPNPFSSSISVYGNLSGMIELKLYSILGKEIMTTKLKGENELKLDLSNLNLPGGIYFLEVNTNSGSKTVRLVKAAE